MLSFGAGATWNINTEGQTGIFTENSDRHQLSIVERHNSVDFFLTLRAQKAANSPDYAVLKIGDLSEKSGKLQLVEKQSLQQTYLIELERKQKTSLLNWMVSQLVIVIDVITEQQTVSVVEFSLVGFTTRLNDFLIAKEIGKLDYRWLLENHKDKELLCYYAANVYVKAMLDRIDNRSVQQTLASIPKTGIEMLDSVTGEMVDNVYGVPKQNLPRDPRGDKYGIFKSCMTRPVR